MWNLSSLFYSSVESPTFLAALDLTPTQRASITSVKNDVRQRLRDALPGALRSLGVVEEAFRPRFFTQGSWAYGTLNAPARPGQQADIDDGAYLPISFISQTGMPKTASQLFFDAAEIALGPLARARGWTLVTSKPTCVRLIISVDAHIDIPLYAIPDAEFGSLEKAARVRLHGDVMDALREAEQDAWMALPTESVLLAHRERGWMKSDPRPVKKWFLDEVGRQGEQFRRIVRYLKAYRDWQWTSGGPASILLMAAAAPHFDIRERRDDLALMDVAAALPRALRDGVSNPIDESESLTRRLGPEGVEDAARKLEAFHLALSSAIHADTAVAASRAVALLFGPRYPNDPTRVGEVTVATTVSAAPARVVPQPLVRRTKAG